MSNLFNILRLSQIIYLRHLHINCARTNERKKQIRNTKTETKNTDILENNTETHFEMVDFAAKTPRKSYLFLLMMLLKSRKHFKSI